MDRTVRIWDPIRGQELQTLKGHDNWVYAVTFHPDGMRLASAGAGGKLLVWDARPADPELSRQREALGLLESLDSRYRSKHKVVEGIRSDKGITDEVRQEALSLLEAYWQRHAKPVQPSPGH